MAGVVAAAVELQAALRVPLPASIQVRIADNTHTRNSKACVEEGHAAIRRIAVALQNRGRAANDGSDVEIGILAVVVRPFVRATVAAVGIAIPVSHGQRVNVVGMPNELLPRVRGRTGPRSK